jgi:DNA-binding MarR family transcriptional regulator
MPSALYACLIYLLHRASQTADDLFVQHQDTLELTPRQYVVLAALSQNEGVSQAEVVR